MVFNCSEQAVKLIANEQIRKEQIYLVDLLLCSTPAAAGQPLVLPPSPPCFPGIQPLSALGGEEEWDTGRRAAVFRSAPAI